MRTSLPFLDLMPERFIKRRFAPLVVTVEDADVTSFMSKCGFTFTELLAAVGMEMPLPLRFTNQNITQLSFKQFESNLVRDMREYSKMFLPEEFETSGKLGDCSSQFAPLIPEKLGDPNSSLIWWRTFIFRVLEKLLYSDFDFCDLPTCIFYITTVDSKYLTPKEVLSAVKCPEWMKEFLSEIPVVCVLVNDSLLRVASKDDTKAVTGFAKVISTSIRTKSGEMLSEERLKGLFGLDLDIMSNPNLGKFISESDISSVKSLLKTVTGFVTEILNESEKTLQADVTKYSGFRYRFLRSGQGELKTNYMGVSIRKIVYLRHAHILMSLGKYAEAQKGFKSFISLLEANELNNVRIRSSFYSALCQILLPNSTLKDFANQVQDTLKVIGQTQLDTRCHCSAIIVSVYAMEAHAGRKDSTGAGKLCKHAISNVYRTWPSSTRYIVAGILSERMACINNRNRHAALYWVRAGVCYMEARLNGHALRIHMWVMKMLPKDKWALLKQQVWLEKVRTLQELNFEKRSLYCCRDLLCRPDLCPFLQERVLSRFWYPFNCEHFDASSVKLEMRNLVEVKSVFIIDSGMPEFYGYEARDFIGLVRAYDKWFKAHVSRSQSISFEEIWQKRKDERNRGNDVTIACGSPVIVSVELTNQFMFAVRLDEAKLCITYEGNEEGVCEIVGEQGFDIPRQSRKGVIAKYEVTPKSQGKFTITDFEKNYWGYVKTSMPCGPLSFHAVHSYPKASMEIEGLPDTVYEDSCLEFSVKISNTGTSRIEGLRFVMDNPSLIAFTGPEVIQSTGKMSAIYLEKGLEPEEVHTVPLILKVSRNGPIDLHMMVDVNGKKLCYAMRKVQTVPAIIAKTDRFAKLNDTVDKIIKCSVQALTDNIRIKGLINGEGKMLRTLLSDREVVLKTNESLQMLAFMSDPILVTLESWRGMGQEGLTLLYQIGDSKLLSQKFIIMETQLSSRGFKFVIPQSVTGKPGTKVDCEVILTGSQEPVYIEALSTTFVDRAKKINGCRWVGKTRVKLCNENGFKAVFTLMTFVSGVYQISGFRTSSNPDFTDAETIGITQRLCVSVEP